MEMNDITLGSCALIVELAVHFLSFRKDLYG